MTKSGGRRNSISGLELRPRGGPAWTNLIKVRNLTMKITLRRKTTMKSHTSVLILLFMARVVVAYGAGSLITPPLR